MAADIHVMCRRGGKGDALAVLKDRFQHEYVRQVHAAREGVVQHKDIAIANVIAVFPDNLRKGRADGSKMHRQRQPLRHKAPLRIGNAGGEVHVVAQNA